MWDFARARRRCIAFLSISIPLAFAGNAGATVALGSKLFADGMVLQRGMSAPVWGTAAAGEDVTISFRGKDVAGKAGADGKWSVKVETGTAGGPFELAVKGSNTLSLKNVYVGEVWLAGGQSNMEYNMQGLAGPNTDSIKYANYPDIHLFTVRGDAKWHPCDTNTVKAFSATGYYFAKNVYAALKIPIGMISSNVGGTEVERWMDPATVAQAMPNDTDKMNSDLYNQFILPLVPYGLRGAIWYQGEADAGLPPRNPHPSWIAPNYRAHFGAMIAGWRKVWGQGDFPFYYVQLANYMAAQTNPGEISGWAELREQQRLTLSVKNTGMAVIIDIGDAGNIHPKDKWDVGKRLALNARALTYGETNLAYSSPIYRSKIIRGNTVRCWFTGADGLKFVGTKLTGFAIAGADNKWVFADAVIDHDTVVVSSPTVANPTQVRYGWANNPACNLYNAAGLPASPFQTEGDQLPIPVSLARAGQEGFIGPSALKGIPGAARVDALGRPAGSRRAASEPIFAW